MEPRGNYLVIRAIAPDGTMRFYCGGWRQDTRNAYGYDSLGEMARILPHLQQSLPDERVEAVRIRQARRVV